MEKVIFNPVIRKIDRYIITPYEQRSASTNVTYIRDFTFEGRLVKELFMQEGRTRRDADCFLHASNKSQNLRLIRRIFWYFVVRLGIEEGGDVAGEEGERGSTEVGDVEGFEVGVVEGGGLLGKYERL